MEPFWHPLSSLLLDAPRSFVTSAVLRRLVSRSAGIPLIYAGDRMWPAVPHGGGFLVDRVPPGRLAAGSVVVVGADGIPELARVEREEAGALVVSCDADPAPPCRVAPDQVLAIARLPASRSSRARRAMRRLWLDGREAVAGRLDDMDDAARTVLDKYDAQAPFYSREPTFEVAPALLDLMRRSVAPGSRVLVAGSGTGRECFRLEEEGWQVTGIDFAPAMVDLARREAARRGAAVRFLLGDLRRHDEPAGSLGAVLFTYDVYSFLPAAAERIALLQRIAGWTAPRGVLLISARRLRTAYGRLVISVQWLRGAGRAAAWGASHTRWIAPDGALHRSFVQQFTDGALRREAARGGWSLGPWVGGHALARRSGRAC